MIEFANRPDARPMPGMARHRYKTFQIVSPLTTHYRKATCAEVDCAHHLNGWATTVLPGSHDEAAIRQALAAGWKATESLADGGFLTFAFQPGQRCFASLGKGHLVPLDREPLFLVRRGDHRGLDAPERVHRRPGDWVDDFSAHQQKLADKFQEG